MSSLLRKTWLSKLLAKRTRPIVSRRPKPRLEIEALEARDVPAVISVDVYPLTPTEGVALGSANDPQPLGQFVVDNYIGFDQAFQLGATITYGDGGTESGVAGPTVQFFQNLGAGRASYQVYGHHTWADAGNFTVTLSIQDGTIGGADNAGSAPIAVADQALTATATQPSVQTVAGGTLTNVDVATFTDGNPLSTASDFTALIIWGNPGAVTPGVITQDSNGVYHVSGSHTYSNPAPTTSAISVIVQHVTSDLTIPNTAFIGTSAIVPEALPLTISEGGGIIPAGTVIGSFTDLGFAAPLTAQPAASYTGAGTFAQFPGAPVTPLTVTQVGSTNVYNLTTSAATVVPAGASEGIVNYLLRVTGSTGVPANTTGSLTIADAALAVVSATAPAPTAGTPLNNVQVLVFSDPNTTTTAAAYTASINWGDGSAPTPGTITSLGGGQFRVNGSHTYPRPTAPGVQYQVTVTIGDVGGAGLIASTPLFSVADAAITPLAGIDVIGTQNQPLNNVMIARFSSANPNATEGDFTATINWAGGPAEAATVVRVGGTATSAIFGIVGSHTFATSGTFGTTYNVISAYGAAPIAGAAGGQAFISAGAIAVSVLPITGVIHTPTAAGIPIATFQDLGGANPGGYTATIDWGDGSATSAGTVVPLGGGQFRVDAPSHTYATTGVFSVRVTVTDSDPSSGIGSNSATIANSTLAVVPPGGPIATPTEGASVSPVVAQFTDTDALKTAGSYVAVIDWGDGSPMSTGTVTGAAGSFTVTGTHTYAHYSAAPRTVRTVITDAFGAQIVAVNSVSGVNDAALTAGPGIPVFALQNQSLINVPVGTFTDANPGATAADFTVQINWGDGNITPGRLSLVGGSAGGAVFTVSGSHVYPSTLGSPYSITYTVTSTGTSTLVNAAGGPATIAQGSIVVTALPKTTTIGTAVPAGVFATFLDVAGPDPLGNYSATIDWGDGTSTNATTIAALGGSQFSVSGPAHNYATPGTYVITVTVTDIDPAVGIGANLVVVQTAAITIAPVGGGGGGGGGGINTEEGTFLNDVQVAQFTSSNPAATVADFTATIDWGDGSPFSTGTITQPGGAGTAFIVTGDHTYRDYSTIGYPVTITVEDNFGSKGTLVTNADVSDAPLTTPAGIAQFASGGQSLVNAPLGTFTDENPLGETSDHAALINWGDGSPASIGFVTLVGGNAGQTFFSVSGSHLYATTGVKNVSITVTDEGGSTTTINTTVTVVGSALGLQSFPITAVEGAPTPAGLLVGTFTDPATGPGVTYTVTINWGDGTPNSTTGTGVVVQPTSPGSTTFNILAPAHTYATHGTYVVQITVQGSNGSGPVTSASLATVADAPLTGVNGGTYVANEGSPLFPGAVGTVVSFIDANPLGQSNQFRATINWGDGSTSLGTITQPGGAGTPFLVSGNHTYITDGTYPIFVEIEDITGTSATTATATAQINQVPVTLNTTPIVVTGQQNVALVNRDVATFTSANPFDRPGTFAATIQWGDLTSSAGTIVVDGNGVYHVQGTHTYTVSGNYAVTVVLREIGDPLILDSRATANVTIAATPLIVTANDVHAIEGVALPNAQSTVNGTIVATFVDLFGADPAAAYTALIEWGNGQITSGTIVPSGGANFAVLAPVTPIIYQDVGTFTVRVTITNADGGSVFQAFATSQATVVDAPLTAAPVQPVVNGFQGTPLVLVEVSEFNDTNPAGLLTDFTATIDWGDGTPQSAGQLRQPGGPGTPFFVVGNHTYANPSTAAPYQITVVIQSDDGARLTTRTTANILASTIIGQPVNIAGTEGLPLVNVVVGYFTDTGTPGPISSYSATIDWGVGTTIGQIVPVGGNTFQVLGTFTYPDAGIFNVTVNVNHNGGLATSFASTANIADAPISGVAVPIFPIEGVPFTGTVAIFTDANPTGVAADFTAVIDWGDGQTTGGTITQNGRTFFVSGIAPVGPTHIYQDSGIYTFRVTVSSVIVGGASFTAFETATVQDGLIVVTGINSTVQEGPVAVAGPAVAAPTFNIATFVDSGNNGSPLPDLPSEYLATINWGDGTVTTGTIGMPTFNGSQFVYPVTASHLYPDSGLYSLTITVESVGGTSLSITTAQITVTEAPLTAGTAITINGVEGHSVTAIVARFTDANLAGAMADFSATIDWGDGTTSAGILGQITTPIGSPTQFTVTGTHTYRTFGSYPISVSIRDLDGPTTTATGTATIANALLSSEGAIVRGVEGIPTGSILIGTFTDANPFSTLAEFTTPPASITINWGDGSSETLGAGAITAIGLPSGVTYRVNAGHTYQSPGNYAITVTVTDQGGGATIIQSLAEITDAPLTAAPAGSQPAITGTEGSTFTGPVFRFNDADPGSVPADFSATINWGDGTTDTGVITQPGGPGTTYVVSGSHQYLDNGNYTVGVVVTSGPQSLNYTTTAVITGVAPTALISNNGPVNENSPATVTLFDPQDPSPIDTAAGFRYSFATSAAGLATTYSSAQAASSQQFTFPDGPSTHTVFARIFDKDGLSSDYSTVVTVNNVAPTATFTVTGQFIPGQPVTATFTNQFDPSPVDTAAGFTYQYDFGTGTFGPATTSPTASFTPSAPGVYIIRGRILDKDGGFTDYTFNPDGLPPFVTVKNVDIFAVGNGDTGGPIVHIFSTLNNENVANFTAYEPTFRGGVIVAVGDVNGDGIPDVVTGTGVGGGPVVKVFDGVDFAEVGSFFAYEPSFRGGVFVAVADTNGDGLGDIITGTGFGGGPVVKVFDGLTFSQRSSFAAYEITARGGVNVAGGDVDGDGTAEVITGAGFGGSSRVRIFSQGGADMGSFFAYDPSFTGGVTVSAGDLFGTGKADIATGTGAGGSGHMKVFDGLTHAVKRSFFAFGPDKITGAPLRNGFNVNASHVGGPNGTPILLAAAGPDYGPTVRIFDPSNLESLGELVPYEDTFTGGAYVG